MAHGRYCSYQWSHRCSGAQQPFRTLRRRYYHYVCLLTSCGKSVYLTIILTVTRLFVVLVLVSSSSGKTSRTRLILRSALMTLSSLLAKVVPTTMSVCLLLSDILIEYVTQPNVIFRPLLPSPLPFSRSPDQNLKYMPNKLLLTPVLLLNL
jgi:hypothetical protein